LIALNTAFRITKRAKEFGDWLSGVGAQVLEPTNEWEVLRFKAGSTTSIIYRNKVGGVTYSGLAKEAWEAFCSGKAWRAAPATKRKPMKPIIAALRKRDGDLCFYCCKEVGRENESAEHLVSITHGGPNHISNLFLTHRTCNARAGHLSAPEKIKQHVYAVIENNGILQQIAAQVTVLQPSQSTE
jgi:hypothetical protein